MEQSFIKERTWYVVCEAVPGVAAHPSDPVAPTQAEVAAAQYKALYMLTKSVEDKILARYTRIRDPTVLWIALRQVCAGNTNTRRNVLKRCLFSLKFSESATMSVNFSTLNELLNDLAAVGVTFTDDELHALVIDALPSSWETFATVLAGRETMPTSSHLENLIREEETHR